jgi:hypothetical protein
VHTRRDVLEHVRCSLHDAVSGVVGKFELGMHDGLFRAVGKPADAHVIC